MTQIDVRPETIGLTADRIIRSGDDWGQQQELLAGRLHRVSDLFGTDRLGQILGRAWGEVGPRSLEFVADTGFCVVETGVVLNRVAAAYTEVEDDNTQRAAAVDVQLERLGTI